ncbi:LysR family transcriptional regulator [Streptomyces sp. NPDC006645]|uniref:LysR family transcriptional regulator n=1 Tax=unclassified Streptomyces TaxID=2593676 RepID=UPI0033A3BEE5
MLNLHQLRLLRELAHRGTIAAVADALSYSPSAVSQQLSLLERTAGVPLLERSGRRVALTPAGANLVRHAEVILERLETARTELAEGREVAGPLRLGIYPSAARALASGLLVSLRRSYPRLEPWVWEVDPADAPDALRAGRLDLALTHYYVSDSDSAEGNGEGEGEARGDGEAGDRPFPVEPGIQSRPVFTERMHLATPADSAPEPDDDPVRRWRDAPWILPTPGTLCHTSVTRLCEASGFHVDSWHRVDDYDTALGLVAAGAGVAVVPDLSARNPPPGTVLTPLSLRRRSEVAFRGGSAAHPTVGAFIAALRESLPTELATGPI